MTLTKKDMSQLDDRLENLRQDVSDDTDRKLEYLRQQIAEDVDNQFTEFKSELFNRIDPVLKEVLTAREERPLIEKRIENLENIHPGGKHS